MELLNATKMQAGYTLGMQPDGRELLVVAIKGTFQIPKNGEEPILMEQQEPLVMADNPIGAWNTFWIKMIGDKISVAELKCRGDQPTDAHLSGAPE